MSIDSLKTQIPDYAKDVKLNLGNVVSSNALTPPQVWGAMLASAQPFIQIDAWLAIWPGLAICLATLSFNLFGDGLRDVLDPRSAR